MKPGRLLFHAGLLVFSILPAGLCALAASILLPGYVLAAASLAALLIQLLGLLACGGGFPHLLNRLLKASSSSLRMIPWVPGRNTLGIERMIVSVNNEALLRRAPLSPRPRKILLLLPHCLQQHECGHRLQGDASACQRCGRCAIGPLSALAEERGMALAIATGGTSARKAVRTAAPDLVIAVACPRDLSSGILDAWPVPAWGELNSQPFGECYDTTVDDRALSGALDALTGYPSRDSSLPTISER
jgi:hypothetical protein